MRGLQLPGIPLLLLLLALLDLRLELSSFLVAIQNHLLAVTILLLQPSLWRHYQRSR